MSLLMVVAAGYSSANTGRFLCPLLILLASFAPLLSRAAYTISPGESLRDGEKLISANEVFELGFFSPGNSANRYVGIWYHNFSTNTVLWVANRQNPVKNLSGTLTIAANGSLVILDASSTILWSSNTSSAFNNESLSLVQLMDSGNLVLNHSGATAWQSFDHPCDTYMPGMKVGLNLLTKENQEITSWTSPDDPAPGNFSLSMDPRGSTQIFMWERGKPRWRSGRWNGQVFIGIQNMVAQYIYGFKLNNFVEEGRMYFYYDQFNSSHRYVLSWDGIERHMVWKNDTSEWFQYWAQPLTPCDFYNTCGMNAGCTDEAAPAPICSCLMGFVPAVSEEWESGNWSSGCIRRMALGCTANDDGGGDGFRPLTGVKLPDLSDWFNDVQDSDGCHDRCLMNCSCKAYAYVTGIGCLAWGLDLLDIHIFSSGGNDLFVRLAGDELKNSSNSGSVIIIVVVVASAVIFLLGSLFLLWKCRKRIKDRLLKPINEERASTYSSFSRDRGGSGSLRLNDESNDAELSELQLWNFDTVLIATKEFSESELIGEGGFGPVYKGVLPGGQEIAVKRLSRSSGQGIEEFKNEVRLISKLQHRNLVRLLGCCIHEQEKILIYEYMPNKSLDALLYDSVKKKLLDWETRYKIIEGIARGLLYLHRDSRLRIIHRDLKASNILLDEEMNPKISDFGMARIFGNYDETATNRVVGTFGYMAPEYAMQGLFSVKSDAYSFGVLVLEIISGKRCNSYLHPELGTSLIATAWKLWNEDRVREIVDPAVLDSCVSKQLQRCVNIGLLCVQDRPVDRPSMASVVVMLESDTPAPAIPRQPTFTTHRSFSETESSTTELNAISANASITMLTGR